MADHSTLITHSVPFKEALAAALRRILRRTKVSAVVRIARLLIHFGPWRSLAKYVIRIIRPPVRSSASTRPSFLPLFDPVKVTDELKENSVAIVGVVDSELLKALRFRTKNLPVDHYKLIHHIDPDIQRLAEDPAIKAVLRNYLKCEPVLLEATIAITEGNGVNSQNSLHFDYAGWESMNVFVYLTDVTDRSSYHMVAQGSHRDIKLRDLFRSGVLSEDEAQRRFGSRIKPIIGEAGTLFFENTEAFHCRKLSAERRVLLNMLYASHQSCLSHGRTTKKHMYRRAMIYREQIEPSASR